MKMSELLKEFNLSRGTDFETLTQGLFIEMVKWITDLQNQIKSQDERIRALEKGDQ